MDNPNVYILDVYNRGIYPRDEEAKKAIRKKVELLSYTKDDKYLQLVEKYTGATLSTCKPF